MGMGKLFYGTSEQVVEVDDMLLAHVQKVIITKLRRGESFPLTWKTATGGRETLWVHASLLLRFALDCDEASERSDAQLLRHLADAANSHHGMDLTDDAVRRLTRPARPVLRAAA
jgi:hypothetical protein